tara:strand:- start:37 stop:603 length:567 start_codon:yes stop_codon:yes gene_type:complete
MSNKIDLRRIYKKKRAVIKDNTLNAASKIIFDSFIKYIGKKKLSILLYHSSIGHHEIPTIHWFSKLKKHHNVFVPKILDNLLDMEAIKWTENIELEKNKFGILQPVSVCYEEAKRLDVIVVPLLCFSKSGHRVGYGKGFYDRFLVRCKKKVQKIGISFFDKYEKIDDITKLDQKLDIIITPSKLIQFT